MKDDLANLRRIACCELTQKMRSIRPFSYLRLGDGELALMLKAQVGQQFTRPTLSASVEIAYDGPGVDTAIYQDLRYAYERCTFLDRHDNLPFNAKMLPELLLERDRSLLVNEGPEKAMILHEWTHQELPFYLESRTCLFAGAEAALLESLHSDPRYHRDFSRFFPNNSQIIFHQVTGDGENLATNLPTIRRNLRAIITERRVDTLFLCLGGAAKPLCVELAEGLGICAVDFGSMMRGLCYSGTSGRGLWRSSHHPYLGRVSLEVFIEAYCRAFPSAKPIEILAKAHAQLCLDLQYKVLGSSAATDVFDSSNYDPTGDNIAAFRRNLAWYRQELRPLAGSDPAVATILKEFDYWLLKKGFGIRGKIFRLACSAKRALTRRNPRGPVSS